MTRLPLLFLDIDGVLIPFGPGMTVGRRGREEWQDGGNPQLAKVDRSLGDRLAALPCELVWASAWMEEANEVVAPLLGLPALPVAELPAEDDAPLHWKTRALVAAAGGRPFVWVDDEIGQLDRVWVARHHPGSALLHRVDPSTGLTGRDLGLIGAWLRR
ncbi:HAD domain-containing protein [Streptomyces hydrogenans]|uniref:HAD domain-containing protein n=1 Tax=Streptomyces hydrogenans TaxID=1873719 RepID=UPI0033332B71